MLYQRWLLIVVVIKAHSVELDDPIKLSVIWIGIIGYPCKRTECRLKHRKLINTMISCIIGFVDQVDEEFIGHFPH